ncbi:Lrp/AsnC ligand binding domain-containing protein [Arthrobacter sp. NPDC058097]|uniref:Lrp/AsnC ligand binding domain-containing protein n=1 Tax=Arthrobacter sp. NPDC058097 TaxID=3346340 RepID=UPI0036DAC7CA
MDLTRFDRDSVRGFEEALAAFDEVVEMHRLFGSPDYFVRVAVADLEAYEEFLSNHVLAIRGIQKVSSRFTMKTIKTVMLSAPYVMGAACFCQKPRHTSGITRCSPFPAQNLNRSWGKPWELLIRRRHRLIQQPAIAPTPPPTPPGRHSSQRSKKIREQNQS